MMLNLSLEVIFEMIPQIIKTVIIGILIFSMYFYTRERGKSTSGESNTIINSDIYMKVFGVYIKKRIINRILLILGALPLLLYPGVLAACVMGIVAAQEFSKSALDMIKTLIFILFTASYLLTYIICFFLYFSKKDKTILVSVIPLAHEALIVLVIHLTTLFE